MQALLKRACGAFFALLLGLLLLPSVAFANEGGGNSVTLTVDGTETTYTTISDAVNAIDSYESATITLDGTFTENVDTGSLNYLTIQAGEAGATINGTLSCKGTSVTISGITFNSVLSNPVGYYDDDNAINLSGSTNVKVSNCSFNGYNYVSNFHANATGVTFTGCTVNGCVFFLHSSDGTVSGLSVTGCKINGTDGVCATLLGLSTVTELSGNTFSNAYFGLQNSHSLEGFLSSNTYDHGYLVDDTVDYGDGLDPHDGSAKLMTILPDGAYAKWISANEGQQSAINSLEDPNAAIITFSGQGVAVGYHYNDITLDYGYYGQITITKTIEGTAAGTDSIAFTVTDESGEVVAEIPYSQLTDGSYTVEKLMPGTYTVTETGAKGCTTTVNGADGSSASVEVKEKETATVAFVNTYPTAEPEKPSTSTPTGTKKDPLAQTGDASLVGAATLAVVGLAGTGLGIAVRRKTR